MNLECGYKEPKPTKRDQSMTVAINAIRRLETKIEDLTTAVNAAIPPARPLRKQSPAIAPSLTSPLPVGPTPPMNNLSLHGTSVPDLPLSPPTVDTPTRGPFVFDPSARINLSFSQHGVALWPAMQEILSPRFVSSRKALPKDYIFEMESQRPPLPVDIDHLIHQQQIPGAWLGSLPLSILKGLADAYFAVFHRLTPTLDKHNFFANNIGLAIDNRFGYDIETCLLLVVLALGCLAVKAHEEGTFPLPSQETDGTTGFVRPDWYDMVLEDPSGLGFFNEARKRFGFLMCQNDIQYGQFYMLSTLYYAQILRPLDSWSMVHRAAFCCVSILKRAGTIDFEEWEGDMFSRLFWNTLMYESIIAQELDLPLSGLQEYESHVPLPRFLDCPTPTLSSAGTIVREDDTLFHFHFLAQASHRILLTRIRHNLYSFMVKSDSPTPIITAEMHHQLEEWRTNLPSSIQFSDDDSVDTSPSPAHVIAKAMLRSRYLVAKFHIGRPFLYKALHFPEHTTGNEYQEAHEGLKGGMYWPTVMGLCTAMKSALPIKFGWSSQCFGQVLLLHAVAHSPNPMLQKRLPEGWEDWVQIMMHLIESCGLESPGIARDAELLRLL
ncbi:hypothetical protein P154DRAFT_449652 [Amniculicola lignicola CBS 123094]|uniref:Xylanolytic transcriptional activator regulatory domain-containing protein n=1 Tax=Amniculicola lignicola CBS 123094 TaxID=1392246 RepID=A0A6A5W7L0_9PLEO|nr:hypothetical protein P154DRAFT_449652 [Amniculicola lignicola CBS 123094]